MSEETKYDGILCIVSSDIDCVICPPNCCRKCLARIKKYEILKEYPVSFEFMNKCKGLIFGTNVKCECPKKANKY